MGQIGGFPPGYWPRFDPRFDTAGEKKTLSFSGWRGMDGASPGFVFRDERWLEWLISLSCRMLDSSDSEFGVLWIHGLGISIEVSLVTRCHHVLVWNWYGFVWKLGGSKRGFMLELPSLILTCHLKTGHPKRKLVFQPSIFRCYVSFREGTAIIYKNVFCATPFMHSRADFVGLSQCIGFIPPKMIVHRLWQPIWPSDMDLNKWTSKERVVWRENCSHLYNFHDLWAMVNDQNPSLIVLTVALHYPIWCELSSIMSCFFAFGSMLKSKTLLSSS